MSYVVIKQLCSSCPPSCTSRHQLIVLRRTKFGRRAFSVAGPTAWNSLPDYLRDPSLSEDTFRRSLKTLVCVVLGQVTV